MRLRPIDQTGDFDAVLAILQACDRDVYGDTDWTPDELREQWAELDLERDAWLAVDDDDRALGVMHLCERRTSTFLADGYVRPSARGRGIGTALVEAVERRVAERVDETPPGSRVTVHLAHLVGDHTAAALLAGRGYERVRSFFRMVIDLDGADTEAVWPPGLELRTLDPDRDGRALHAADTLAFAQEWGYEERPYDEWFRRLFVTPRVDLDLPVVAWDGERVAGYALNYPKRMGDWGWISVVGVIPDWRRRGVGLALLRESFRRIRATGETVAALGVDVENPTGATRLYERAGMRTLWQADVWEKEVRPGG